MTADIQCEEISLSMVSLSVICSLLVKVSTRSPVTRLFSSVVKYA